jgi:hypothetical protein
MKTTDRVRTRGSVLYNTVFIDDTEREDYRILFLTGSFPGEPSNPDNRKCRIYRDRLQANFSLSRTQADLLTRYIARLLGMELTP